MTNQVKLMLETLGHWFEFKVIEHGDDLYVASAQQWYRWTGAEWEAMSRAKVPRELWSKQPPKPQVHW